MKRDANSFRAAPTYSCNDPIMCMYRVLLCIMVLALCWLCILYIYNELRLCVCVNVYVCVLCGCVCGMQEDIAYMWDALFSCWELQENTTTLT